MPPRRGRGRGKFNTPTKKDQPIDNSSETAASTEDPEISEDAIKEENGGIKVEAMDTASEETPSDNSQANGNVAADGPAQVDVTYPYQIRVSYLPETYNYGDLVKYIATTFKVVVPKIVSPKVNSPWVLLCFSDAKQQEGLLAVLDNHAWRKKLIRATAHYPLENRKRKHGEGEDDMESKKNKADVEAPPPLTIENEILSESLPLLSVPYELQNRLSRQDAELMAHRMHGLVCHKNPDLEGWAEQACNENDGHLFKIDPLRVCTSVHGYRNKCKLRIGKNAEGQTTVGFCLNDNENKILAVEPGDKFIHLPDSMKYAAKKFQNFVRTIGYEPYDKKKKTGVWDNLLIRVAPGGALMLMAIVSPANLTDKQMAKLKEDLTNYFTTGDGKDCNVFSLYLQALQDQHPIHPLEKLELLSGKPDYEENICGLKFYVSPFSILNINPSSSENIYNSVVELAEPTQQHVIIDVCAGSCGISFTFANKVEKCYAIEPQEENVRDALKTKALNKITNVEIIKGKCEDHLEKLFEKVKGKRLIVVLDPPRHGVVSKIISLIRAQSNIERLVYVCSNTKTGVKNFLDLCSKCGRENNTAQVMYGLPFLPIRGIPIDVAPYTVNNTVPLLLKRIDPSAYPPATKKPPPPVNRESSKKKPAGRRKQDMGHGGRGPRGPLRGVRGGGVRGMRGGRGGGPGGSYPAPPFMRPPPRPLMGGRRMMPQGGGRYGDTNIINKYERRIAELEQQDRAFKAGLSMGLQAANRGGSNSSNPRNMGDYSTGEGFGGYRGGYKDPYGESSSPWQGNGSNSSYGSHTTTFSPVPDFTADSYGNTPPMSGGSGYGAHAAYGARPKPHLLTSSRFVGMNSGGRGGRGPPERSHRGGLVRGGRGGLGPASGLGRR